MPKKIIITGSGIKSLSHMTVESLAAIEQADIVLYLLNESILAQWVEEKAKQSESLEELYFSEALRQDAYKKIAGHVLLSSELHDNVCLVVYGHPLLLSNSVGYLLKQVDRDRVNVLLLPAISSLDCLLCDLEVDPLYGCFSIDATELIYKNKMLDNTNHLILWQIGMINNSDTDSHSESITGLSSLQNLLLLYYDANHDCVFYEASILPHIPPKITRTTLANMHLMSVTRITSLYVPAVTITNV